MSRPTCGIVDSMNPFHFRYSKKKKTRLIHSILCSCLFIIITTTILPMNVLNYINM